MKKVWIILRALLSALLLMGVGIPALLYVLLSLDPVHTRIREYANRELSRVLGADLYIHRLGFRPFSRLELRDVSLNIEGDTVAKIHRVSAGLDFWHLIRRGQVVVDYALVEDVSLNLYRDSISAPINIQPVIDALRNDDPDREPSPFSLALNTVILRNAAVSYNVLNAPLPEDGRFCPDHILIDNLELNAYVPRLSNDSILIELEHFGFREQSGFMVNHIEAQAVYGQHGMLLKDLSINLPESHLAFRPVQISYQSPDSLVNGLLVNGVTLATAGTNHIYPPDLMAFAPDLENLDAMFSLDMDVRADSSEIDVRRLRIIKGNGSRLALDFSASVLNPLNNDSISFDLSRCDITCEGSELAASLGQHISNKVGSQLRRIPLTHLSANASGNMHQASAAVNARTPEGELALDISAHFRNKKITRSSVELDVRNLNVGAIAGIEKLGAVSGNISADVIMERKPIINGTAEFSGIEFGGYDFRNINVILDMPEKERGELTVTVNDPAASVQAYSFFNFTGEVPVISATTSAVGVDFAAIGLTNMHPDHRFGIMLTAELTGRSIDSMAGRVAITDIHWLDARHRGLRLPRLILTADPTADPPSVTINSDLVHGRLTGPYSLSSIAAQIEKAFAAALPSLDNHVDAPVAVNDFNYSFTIEPCEEVSRFFNLPVSLPAPAQISGSANSDTELYTLKIEMPYLVQGDKIYENTGINLSLDGGSGLAKANIGTSFPTKKGPMTLMTDIKAQEDSISTLIDWNIERTIPLAGRFDMGLRIRPVTPVPGKTPLLAVPVKALLTFNPGSINFGNDTWRISPASVSLTPDSIVIRHLNLDAGDQHLSINGKISERDTVLIELADISLLPIFETLEIDKAMLSGTANGVFRAADVLSGKPFLECKNLHVDSIGYNRCTIGDADILARWDNDKQSFFLDADIMGPDGNSSRIKGDIFPLAEAMDLDFRAERVPVGFLRPFMEAFARDIRGHATGHCRLFGTFKEVDLEGDVWADSVSMVVDFTNTTYTCTDSVILRPGKIIVPSAIMTDEEGHTARIEGWVNHIFFKRPSFRFDVTEAHNFLSFNATERQNPDWYGRIYGNGSASISGEPGLLNITADMSTGPGTTFTYVISDRLDAVEYSFIEFRDVTPDSIRTSMEIYEETEPESVRRIRHRLAHTEEEEPTVYDMDIAVDITKDAALTLIMDPASGDDIKAVGTGHLRMTYNSEDDDLRMYGGFSVLSGSYHFTLQDIIIKDFTIKEGSTINFDGDPYAIRTNLTAYYATNANITDLDQSFQQDRDVARTNVPVHAIMKVSGDIRQPDIRFDLEFPTLTEETYRKVRSIVSTDDMMNRQIIYLLALNRFYTPDYMSNTTKGSELFSVASSTISSQLSSLLGKISDNWTIAPNLRSDRGDFSDVEVDLSLSSRLLNNRLLFNGNFGYRDKSLNTNQFVGDFDIEYLLNPRGTWRLKAYNRYNDANYYLRSAATTQGVGIMYRRDFDRLFNFLRPRRKSSVPADTVR